MDNGKMANVNAAAVMHDGQWLKISDRDEVNDLKKNEWIPLANSYDQLVMIHDNGNLTIDISVINNSFDQQGYYLPNGYYFKDQIAYTSNPSDLNGQSVYLDVNGTKYFICHFSQYGTMFRNIPIVKQ
ncbi:hypothetical protein DY124_06075 [Apilactobacillus micheneri]|uniref:hypothetical protein n=1 Tax=Apilactobacillus micheneri TaxID=1899430 RepID=UPI0011271DA5|nr:hypothetical protein [Apilactobacillus micheneri]TPR43141.1 hypothetical protein DY124_06075 [Apilactobacillus micheneri]TPR47229.1 hypothetical protein DY125_06570 [Apilactobacillus micheneri]